MVERDTGPMLLIGSPCHACRCEEFLPLMCSGCQHKFCANHAAPDAHACPKQARDFLVPLCPLCREPPRDWRREASATAIQRLLQRHWTVPSVAQGGCRVLLAEGGQEATRSATRRCTEPSCRTVLHVAIQCPRCRQDYCVRHRAPQQHACAHETRAQDHLGTVQAPLSRLRERAITSRDTVRAMLPAASIPTTLVTPAVSSNTPEAPVAASRPDRAAQRRAAEERRSAIRAMQARHARGLLSDAEQLVLAQKMAEDAAAAPPKPGCPIA